MKIRTLFILSAILIGVPQVSYSQYSDIPKLTEHESYSNVREKMIKAGWKPYTREGAI
ncbi:hypothetical protein [Aeromonas veronii]|uniref:hypothetical protein n=1 Tax=Aeromonas veronii TaxID=654 RepID=UPI003D2109A9